MTSQSTHFILAGQITVRTNAVGARTTARGPLTVTRALRGEKRSASPRPTMAVSCSVRVATPLGPKDHQLSAPESQQERVRRGSGRLAGCRSTAVMGPRIGKTEGIGGWDGCRVCVIRQDRGCSAPGRRKHGKRGRTRPARWPPRCRGKSPLSGGRRGACRRAVLSWMVSNSGRR